MCVLKSTLTEHPALLLDFGKELQGGLQLVTGMPPSHDPVSVRVRFGESVSEAMCEIDGANGASNDHDADFRGIAPLAGRAGDR